MVAVLLGVLVGAAMPVQTTVNTRLRGAVGSPFSASFVSFAVGTITLAVVTLLILRGPPDLAPAAALPPWIWAGGLLGAIALTTNVLLFPRLGSVQTVVLPIAGSVLMGLVIDHVALFGAPRAGLSATRVVGASLLVVGVLGAIGVADAALRRTVVARAATGVPARADGAGLWGWRALGVLAGVLAAAQTTINGRLGVVVGSAGAAALVSFAVGTVVLLAVVLLTRAPWRISRVDGRVGPWWMWIGGCPGAAVVFANAYLAPVLGTGLTVMVTQLGMIAGGLVVDQVGLLGAPRRPVTALQVVGVLLMVAGVAVIRVL